MKKILIILCAVFICGAAIAQTIRWHIGDTVYQTTTCNAGESITPPTAPEKFGYHLKEWKVPYTQIEYLESTGTQYIDTGYSSISNKTPRLIGDFAITQKRSNAYDIIGVGTCSYNGGPNIGLNPSGYFSYDDNDTRVKGIIGVRYLYDLDNPNSTYRVKDMTSGNFVVDIIIGTGLRQPSCRPNIFLFGFACSCNSSPYGMIYAKLYSAKLYDNDVLVRDFIPVLDLNGTPCMFDKVEGKFYYNAGTGQFIAGPVIGE